MEVPDAAIQFGVMVGADLLGTHEKTEGGESLNG